jgi:hypothetical protein
MNGVFTPPETLRASGSESNSVQRKVFSGIWMNKWVLPPP